jgi:hypothetical protein
MLRRRGERSARSGGEGTRAHAWPSPPIRPPGGRLRAQDRRIHRWSDWRARGRMPRATRKGRTDHGWQCGREMAGAGHEQPACHAGNPAVASVRCRSVLRSRRGRQEMRYRRAAWTRARLQHISPRMNRAEARPSPEPVFRAPHERPICGYTFDKRRILLHVGFARRRPRFRRLRVVRMRASGL